MTGVKGRGRSSQRMALEIRTQELGPEGLPPAWPKKQGSKAKSEEGPEGAEESTGGNMKSESTLGRGKVRGGTTGQHLGNRLPGKSHPHHPHHPPSPSITLHGSSRANGGRTAAPPEPLARASPTSTSFRSRMLL